MTTTPTTPNTHTTGTHPTWPRLETEHLPTDADTVIIGSGFGGSVAAARLAQAGKDILLLERGREWIPGEFPDDFASVRRNIRTRHNPMGLFDLALGLDVDRLIANGLGGGSLIYANVMLPPEPEVFNDPHWPEGINLRTLTPYIGRVRAMLRPEHVQRAPKHVEPLTGLAHHHKLPVKPVPVAVNLTRPNEPNPHGIQQNTCTHCGNCVTGCNVGAKTTMRASYLPLAHSAGARIVTRTEVRTIEPSPKPHHRWRLRGWRLNYVGAHYERTPFTLDCTTVILSAGALGTTALLLRSSAAGLALSPNLGHRFSGNADSLALSYNAGITRQAGIGARDQFAPDSEYGPTIARMIDRRNGAHGHLIQDAVIPYPIATMLRRLLAGRFALSGDERIYCDLRPGGCPPGCSAIEHSQLWLAMGTDEANGTVRLGPRGEPTVHWPDAHRQNIYRQQQDDFAHLSETGESIHISNPRHLVRRSGIPAQSPVTVHALGGAAMGPNVDTGVIDRDHRVYTGHGNTTGTAVHPGLYVIDGAASPTSLGANPALTIAALAERAAERLLHHENETP
ncbi:GMC family oxidoreductase N-terminal domain-containing protein [Dermatophilus congolensis]|uniref:Cholesterol oxidase n=1 Tax=Dermatophilus congolensis TaxID=1863 RepID=A0A239VA28_9MICO|nr:GMC family oxidoreductase [Dermatophilus congolensis]MBO3130524.1 GMC family oxidoreductase [Dermatophilus congolensis]MBO3130846.1 GMC family oxidoreductase [Dermatophilus congolensis]MBO3134996.1 GMC family oxidoreductase [Dermatophilus congolensis]MBO3137235.1 GMC family oxidoreductase [Dermatophilus congolensis]MBO3139480.1 GMC family oxidoreductase [Dermatophilus congolensis]